MCVVWFEQESSKKSKESCGGIKVSEERIRDKR